MDSLFTNMDFLIKHWAPFPRHFPSAFPVVSADFLDHKMDWVRNRFKTCNFSLILRGGGEYIRNGIKWPVQAPCVISQWPGEYLEYGPSLPNEAWDELHIDYDASIMPKLQQNRFVNLDRPVWPIADASTVHAHVAELEALSNSPTPELIVDRLDRVCERILLETWLVPANANGGGVIHAMAAQIRRDLSKTVDFEDVAEMHGMSTATFRRRWAEVIKVPPGHYLQQLRMREARRLLAETNLPVNEIAHAVGFEDELYFSRRFRKETGKAPRDYRKAYQIIGKLARDPMSAIDIE